MKLNNRFRQFVTMMIIATLGVSMTACTTNDVGSENTTTNNVSATETSSSNTKVSTTDKSEKVVINFFHRWPNDPKNSMFNELINEYMEENPHVEIKMDCILNDQYKEKIRMVVSTDEVPDIFSSWSGTFAQEMIASGNVLALNEVYNDDPEWGEKIAQASKDGFTFDGQIYAAPWSQDGKVFYYNKKIFNEHNIEIPTTWSEFIAVLDKLQSVGYDTPIIEGLTDNWAILHYLGTMNQRMLDAETLQKDYEETTGEFTDFAYVEVLNKWKQLTSYMGEISTDRKSVV